MFCCAVCSVMFTGVYPEVIVATPCGHVFHSKCMQLCLPKSKCPFCNLRIEKSQLIQLHLQIDKNWKATAASLRSKANSSIISLDETLNETLKVEDPSSSNSIHFVESNLNDSFVEVSDILSSGEMCFQKPSYNSKTLLTTSLSGVVLVPKIKNLLSIFNDMIPNSEVKMRFLISENKLMQLAAVEGFTNMVIINMQLGNPIGLYFIDIIKHIKMYVVLKSYECHDYEKLPFKIKAPLLVIKSIGKLNEFQEYVIHFFSEICKTHTKEINAEKMNFECNDSQIKFTYNLAGLHFCMITPSSNMSKEIIF